MRDEMTEWRKDVGLRTIDYVREQDWQSSMNKSEEDNMDWLFEKDEELFSDIEVDMKADIPF